jgi:Membrane proteins related to metalloendopeptidases
MMKKQSKTARILAIIMVCLLLLPVLGDKADAASKSEISDLENQKAGIGEKKRETKEKLDSLQMEQDSAIEQKTMLDEQCELTRQKIEIITEQIDIHKLIIETKVRELEAAIIAEEKQFERYTTRIRAMEENGIAGYIEVIFKATSFADFLGRLDMIAEVIEYDRTLKEELTIAKEHVSAVKTSYEDALAESESTRNELEQCEMELEAELEIACALVQQLEEEIYADLQKYNTMIATEYALQIKIDSLSVELQRQEDEARKAAEANGQTYNPSTAVGASGSLMWPVPSDNRVSSLYGMRFHPVLQVNRPHNGIDVCGASGASIVAADGGTVAVATYDKGFGNYVVLNHGNGNTTLYAHMSSTAVSVGDSVSQGQTIGYVGSTGLSTGPHLHFEVRVGGALANPLDHLSNYRIV